MNGVDLIEVQSGVATPASVRAMAEALLNPAFRQEVKNLRALLPKDMTPNQRAANCVSVLTVLLSSLSAPDTSALEYDFGDIECHHPLSVRFMMEMRPLSKWRWREHLDVLIQDGRAMTARCSGALFDIICAAEDLWGCEGHLIKRTP